MAISGPAELLRKSPSTQAATALPVASTPMRGVPSAAVGEQRGPQGALEPARDFLAPGEHARSVVVERKAETETGRRGTRRHRGTGGFRHANVVAELACHEPHQAAAVLLGPGQQRAVVGAAQWRVWKRITEDAEDDDNPDISDHVGRSELRLARCTGSCSCSAATARA